ncbi:MAG: dynamin family protein [Planctomycetota bacterium]
MTHLRELEYFLNNMKGNEMAAPILERREALLRSQAPQCRELLVKYDADCTQLDRLSPLIQNFRIRFPLVGAFSSGKTSLLNAALGETLLSEDITPETAVPAELRYEPQRSFAAHKPDGSATRLTEEDVRNNRVDHLSSGGWLEIGLPNQLLASHPHLILVDLPGWDSGVSAHERVIDAYSERSLAYGVVLSAEEGTLRESLRKALIELAIKDKPVALIISKADKKLESEVNAVAASAKKEITELMGKPPIAVAVTSARKRSVSGFVEILSRLERDSHVVFEQSVVSPYAGVLRHFRGLLDMRANDVFKDRERLDAEIEELNRRLKEFEPRLQRETANLDEKIDPILGSVRARIEQALAGRLETLTDRALDGSDISDDVIGTARLVISEALRRDFEPAMLRYLERLEDALPSRVDLRLDIKASDIAKDKGAGDGDFKWKALSTGLSAVLLKMPHPLAKIAGVAVMALGLLFGGGSEARASQDVEERRRREAARREVRSALDKAVRQIEAQLSEALKAQVQRAKTEVAASIERERAELQRTFDAIGQQIQQGEAAAESARESARRDLALVDGWLQAIGVTHPVEQR